MLCKTQCLHDDNQKNRSAFVKENRSAYVNIIGHKSKINQPQKSMSEDEEYKPNTGNSSNIKLTETTSIKVVRVVPDNNSLIAFINNTKITIIISYKPNQPVWVFYWNKN